MASCNRAAKRQAAGRGLAGSCCRGAGHEEGEKESSRGLPRQKFSKSTLCVFRLDCSLFYIVLAGGKLAFVWVCTLRCALCLSWVAVRGMLVWYVGVLTLKVGSCGRDRPQDVEFALRLRR